MIGDAVIGGGVGAVGLATAGVGGFAAVTGGLGFAGGVMAAGLAGGRGLVEAGIWTVGFARDFSTVGFALALSVEECWTVAGVVVFGVAGVSAWRGAAHEAKTRADRYRIGVLFFMRLVF